MNRRNALKLIGPSLLAVVLAGCSSFPTKLFATSAHTYTDDIAAQIVDALDTHDRQALIDLFSKQALEEADDLEVGISYMFAFYRGESIAVTAYGGYTADHYGGNQRMKRLHKGYIVETTQTTQGTYRMFFVAHRINEENPRKVGLYSISLLSETDVNAEGFTNPVGFAPSIYYPGRSDEYQRTPEHEVQPNPRAQQ
jgi:hypothetical protein